jgi:hypothetical protein
MQKSKLLELADTALQIFNGEFTVIELLPIDGEVYSLTIFKFQSKTENSTRPVAIIHGAGEWDRIQTFAEAFRSREQNVFWNNYTADITHEALTTTPHDLATGQYEWRTDLGEPARYVST